MSEENQSSSELVFDRFFEYVLAQSKSDRAEQLTAYVAAFERVRTQLSALEQEGVCVLRGYDIAEEYERGLTKGEVAARPRLDYVVRKDTVELQIDVKLAPSDGFALMKGDFGRYRHTLCANAKTEEVVIVWATADLLAISLGLVDVEERLRPDADELILFDRNALGPLNDVIRAALARNRPVLVRDFEIRLLERPEFDLLGFFAEKLESHVQRLRDTADRRTYPGRKEAIQSISPFDTRLLKEILNESCSHELSIEELRVRLEKLTV